MNQMLRIAYDNSVAFAHWIKVHSHFAESSFHVLQGCMWVLVTYFFAGAQPVSAFIRESGCAKRFTFSGWFFAWGAIGLGLLDLYLVQKGWAKENLSAGKFYHGGVVILLSFFAQSTLLSPFVEEAVARGFLYRAFRGSCALLPSTVLVIAFQSYFHWGLVSHDLAALVFMIALGTVLCFIRERTGNTWNCVLFHAVYNLTVLGQWLLSIMAMAILLPLCDRRNRAKNLSVSQVMESADAQTSKDH